jgi:murein L,D-transpeptidase YafK
VIIVEKSTHQVYLYKNEAGMPKLVKTYQVATGKIKGDKQSQGDHKTPEGVYFIQEFYSGSELVEKYGKEGLIYGAGAFTLSYPNLIDKRNNKNGGGIWIHSTDDDSRVSKGLDSRGCVVAIDKDLKDLSQYIELNKTPVVIVDQLSFLNKTSWEKQRKYLFEFFYRWKNSWQNKDFETYINSYSKESFTDRLRGNFNQFRTYKRNVFQINDTPVIEFTDMSLFVVQDYALVNMTQDYRSKNINDVGRKTLYLQKDQDYDWKIVAELWQKVSNENEPFTPSNRFFNK